MSRLWVPSLFLILVLSGCGGSDSSPAPSNPSAPPPANGGGGGATSPVTEARIVSVGPGQTVSGIDIAVSSPANSAGVNAENLGVTELNGSGSARNTGATIRRGTTMRVILFGRALHGGLNVTILGPNDISVSNIRSITSQTGKSGIAFDASVAANATLGARTVVLRDTNSDISTFTGGLEVIP